MNEEKKETVYDTEDKETVYDAEDIEKNKTIAGLAYFIFFLPLLAAPDSEYAKFHANQGLLLFILAVGGHLILGMIPIIGWLLILPFGIFVLILGIMGLINGFGGKAKELPMIGKFQIIQ
ncbi:MAG: hypothetical protein L0I79_06595 [Atopostipes sp.]|nr:hypothetical protein [Atopostipes sp.]